MGAAGELVVTIVPELDPEAALRLMGQLIDAMSDEQLDRLAARLDRAYLRRQRTNGPLRRT